MQARERSSAPFLGLATMTNEPLAGGPATPPDPAAAECPCILIADDDAVHRTVISRMAQASGYVSVEAGTYSQIAALLKTRKFDCISLDLSLGDHSGIEVLQLMAQLGVKTPLIIVSGSDEAVLAEAMKIARHHALNIYPPLAKPLSMVDLRLAFTTIRARSRAGLEAKNPVP